MQMLFKASITKFKKNLESVADQLVLYIYSTD